MRPAGRVPRCRLLPWPAGRSRAGACPVACLVSFSWLRARVTVTAARQASTLTRRARGRVGSPQTPARSCFRGVLKLALLFLPAVLSAAVTCTTVSGPIYQVSGDAATGGAARFNGTVSVTLLSTIVQASQPIRPATITTRVVGGGYSICLPPAVYSVRHSPDGGGLDYTTTWTVPQSGSPVAIGAIEQPGAPVHGAGSFPGGAGSGGSGATWGAITGVLSFQSDLAAALSSKEPAISSGTTAQFWRGDKSWQSLNAAVWAGLSATGPLSFNASTGVFSCASCGAGSSSWGAITGTLASQSDLSSALGSKEPAISSGSTSQFWRGDKSWQSLSSAVRGSLSAAGPLSFDSASGAFSCSTCMTSLSWGGIGGTLASQTDLSSALGSKEPAISSGTTSQFWRGDKTWQSLNAAVWGGLSASGPLSFNSSTGAFSCPTCALSSRTISTTAPLTGGGDLSSNRTLAISNFTGDSGSGGAAGAVPAPGAGAAAAGKFLRADGTWAVPSSGSPGANPPACTILTGMGSGATCVFDSNSNNNGGVMTLTTGTGTSYPQAPVLTVTWGTAWAHKPACVWTGLNSRGTRLIASQWVFWDWSNSSTTAGNIYDPSGGGYADATVYMFAYSCQ